MNPRTLFVAYRSSNLADNAWGPVGRLDYDGNTYRFWYLKGSEQLRDFTPFPGMDDVNQVYESESLFPVFENRLLSKARGEYDAYLRWSGFDPIHPPDPVAILGVTEGLRETDAIEVFPCPTPDEGGTFESKFFLHGVRWMPPAALDRISQLQANELLVPMPDPCNQADGNAVAVRTEANRTLIGYVPRYLSRDVKQVLEGCGSEFVELHVDRLNLDAPLQHRVLCRIRACWPFNFQPCSGVEYEPIPLDVPFGCDWQP